MHVLITFMLTHARRGERAKRAKWAKWRGTPARGNEVTALDGCQRSPYSRVSIRLPSCQGKSFSHAKTACQSDSRFVLAAPSWQGPAWRRTDLAHFKSSPRNVLR